MSLDHNHGVDWWAFGILVFEMLAGYDYIFKLINNIRYPPFYDSNTYEIYKKITIGYYEFPSYFSLSARKLISSLIEPNISKRLGCLSVSFDLFPLLSFFPPFYLCLNSDLISIIEWVIGRSKSLVVPRRGVGRSSKEASASSLDP